MPTDTDDATGNATSPIDATAPEVSVAASAAPEVSVAASSIITSVAELVVTTEEPSRIEVTARSGDHVVEVPQTAALATDHEIPVVGLRSDRVYDITIESFTADGTASDMLAETTFRVPSLPDWIPDHQLTIDADRVSPGYTIIETSPSEPIPDGAPERTLVAYDNEGEIVWYYPTGDGFGALEQSATGTFTGYYWPFGIREIDVTGTLVGHWSAPTFSTTDESVPPASEEPAPAEGHPGDIPPIPVTADWIELDSFHHENVPLPNGNILTLSTTAHALTQAQRDTFCPGDPAPFDVISDVVVEFDHSGTVLRTWDLWDAIDIDDIPGNELCGTSGQFTSETLRDWTHANSAIYDEERDAVIVSSRHTDQIIAFDRDDETGPQSDVRWILGAGATMPLDGEPTYHQHAVEVNDDGTIIVYDNGNTRPTTSTADPANPPYSRAVIYDVDDRSADPAEWSARQLWEARIDDESGEPVYTAFIGDADQLANGNVLITHGGIGSFPPDPDDPLHALIIEVEPTGVSGGDVVFRLDTDPTSPHTVYRSERIESFYVGDDWVPRSG